MLMLEMIKPFRFFMATSSTREARTNVDLSNRSERVLVCEGSASNQFTERTEEIFS